MQRRRHKPSVGPNLTATTAGALNPFRARFTDSKTVPTRPVSQPPPSRARRMRVSLGKISLILSVTLGLSAAAGCASNPSAEPAGGDDGTPPLESTEATVILNDFMWTVEDNGQDIDWNNATALCDDLTLGGFSDWGLASIPQLEALYDPAASYVPRDGTNAVHVRSPIRLTTYYVWSSERSGTGSAWYFFFGSGYRNSLQVSNSTNGRVLCVRAP